MRFFIVEIIEDYLITRVPAFAVPDTTALGHVAAAVPAAVIHEAAIGIPDVTQVAGRLAIAIFEAVSTELTPTPCSRRLLSVPPSPTAFAVRFPAFSKVVHTSYDCPGIPFVSPATA